MMLFCIGVQVLSICGIWFLLWWRNKQRAAQADAHAVEGIAKGFNDETDLKNPYFKVSVGRDKLERRLGVVLT